MHTPNHHPYMKTILKLFRKVRGTQWVKICLYAVALRFICTLTQGLRPVFSMTMSTSEVSKDTVELKCPARSGIWFLSSFLPHIV